MPTKYKTAFQDIRLYKVNQFLLIEIVPFRNIISLESLKRKTLWSVKYGKTKTFTNIRTFAL